MYDKKEEKHNNSCAQPATKEGDYIESFFLGEPGGAVVRERDKRETRLSVLMHRFMLFLERWALRAHLRLFRSEIGINTYIIVCKLSHFRIINTDNLRLFRSAKTAAWNEMHDPKNDGGHDERVGKARDAIGRLVS